MANTLAYGFVDLQNLYATRVSEVGVERVYRAIQESAAEYTRNVNALMAEFVERTTVAKEQYELPGTGTLQPMDEWGNALPVTEAGYYNVAYPIQGGATAWGDNRVARALITVEETNRMTVEAFKRDQDWIRRHLLASVFDNVAWTFVDRSAGGGYKGLGSITIEPLANGDTVTYVLVGGSTATDNHYLYQANAISDTYNPFPTIYDELMEHPSNQGPIVVYVPTALTTTIEALTNYTPVDDPAIRYGIATERLNAPVDRGLGDEVLGYVDKCWIVEWRALPSTHMLAHCRGTGPVLKMREYPAPELQGFFPESFMVDGQSIQLKQMIRYAGFGCANRIGAAVYYVGGSSYSIPAGYDAPLAI
jgi:hypothetical protein